MSFGLFPDPADRPWRGVALVAWQGLSRTLLSGWTWLYLLGMPTLMVGFVSLSADDGPRIGLVGEPSPELLELLEELPDVRIVAELPPDHGLDAAVWLDPDGGLDGSAHAESFDAATTEQVHGTIGWLQRELRLRSALTEDDRSWIRGEDPGAAPEDTLEEDLEEVAHVLEDTAHGVTLILAGAMFMMGLMEGVTRAIKLSTERATGLFGVLRLGTPAVVLYLGMMLEAVATNLVFILPIALPLGLLLFLLPMGIAAVLPALLLPLLRATLLGSVAALTVFTVSSALTSLAAAVERESRLQGLLWMPLMLSAVGLGYFLSTASPLVQQLATALPAMGPVVAVHVLDQGGSPLFAVLAVLVQIPVIWTMIRLGAWAFGLDESPLDAWRRRRP